MYSKKMGWHVGFLHAEREKVGFERLKAYIHTRQSESEPCRPQDHRVLVGSAVPTTPSVERMEDDKDLWIVTRPFPTCTGFGVVAVEVEAVVSECQTQW